MPASSLLGMPTSSLVEGAPGVNKGGGTVQSLREVEHPRRAGTNCPTPTPPLYALTSTSTALPTASTRGFSWKPHLEEAQMPQPEFHKTAEAVELEEHERALEELRVAEEERAAREAMLKGRSGFLNGPVSPRVIRVGGGYEPVRDPPPPPPPPPPVVKRTLFKPTPVNAEVKDIAVALNVREGMEWKPPVSREAGVCIPKDFRPPSPSRQKCTNTSPIKNGGQILVHGGGTSEGRRSLSPTPRTVATSHAVVAHTSHSMTARAASGSSQPRSYEYYDRAQPTNTIPSVSTIPTRPCKVPMVRDSRLSIGSTTSMGRRHRVPSVVGEEEALAAAAKEYNWKRRVVKEGSRKAISHFLHAHDKATTVGARRLPGRPKKKLSSKKKSSKPSGVKRPKSANEAGEVCSSATPSKSESVKSSGKKKATKVVKRPSKANSGANLTDAVSPEVSSSPPLSKSMAASRWRMAGLGLAHGLRSAKSKTPRKSRSSTVYVPPPPPPPPIEKPRPPRSAIAAVVAAAAAPAVAAIEIPSEIPRSRTADKCTRIGAFVPGDSAVAAKRRELLARNRQLHMKALAERIDAPTAQSHDKLVANASSAFDRLVQAYVGGTFDGVGGVIDGVGTMGKVNARGGGFDLNVKIQTSNNLRQCEELMGSLVDQHAKDHKVMNHLGQIQEELERVILTPKNS